MSIRVHEITRNKFSDLKTELEIYLQQETDFSNFRLDMEIQFGLYKAVLTQPYTAVSSTTFTGVGLDDATFGGTHSGAGQKDALIRVTIDSEGTPDTFKWSLNGVEQATGIAITAGAIALGSTGITITFLATTGHTDTEYWEAFYMIP